MRISVYAMAYAHSIGFDTAMCVGEYKGYPLYVCMYKGERKEQPCIGLPQYLILKDLKPIPLSLEETMEVIQRKKHRKRYKRKKNKSE